MKKQKLTKTKTAMTLTELLVATVMIGIVMVGVVSVDYAIRSSNVSSSNMQLLASHIQSAMLELTRDAMATSGDASDAGIVPFTHAPTSTIGICFRQDVDINNAQNNTPGDYSDDHWTCYVHGSSNEIGKCNGLTDSIPVLDPGLTRSHCEDMIDDGHGTFFKAIAELTGPGFYNIVYAGTRIDYIEFTITSRPDPSLAADPISNPEYTLTSRVSPPSLGR